MRADQLLVAQGLAPTRSAAQRLITAGAAQWQSAKQDWAVIKKTGEDLAEHVKLRVMDDAELRFVSRGGLKLEGALKHTGIKLGRYAVLDMGQSTGGFTDVLLKAGAKRVVGVDVGHSQLHTSLREHRQVVGLENLHVRELKGSALKAHAPRGGFKLIVGDLSFISMLGALPHLDAWLARGGAVLLLIKPQFELGKKALAKGGLVKDASQYPLLETQTRAAAATLGWTVHDYFESPITGGDGNKEFFLWAQAPEVTKESA